MLRPAQCRARGGGAADASSAPENANTRPPLPGTPPGAWRSECKPVGRYPAGGRSSPSVPVIHLCRGIARHTDFWPRRRVRVRRGSGRNREGVRRRTRVSRRGWVVRGFEDNALFSEGCRGISDSKGRYKCGMKRENPIDRRIGTRERTKWSRNHRIHPVGEGGGRGKKKGNMLLSILPLVLIPLLRYVGQNISHVRPMTVGYQPMC